MQSAIQITRGIDFPHEKKKVIFQIQDQYIHMGQPKKQDFRAKI